MQRDLFEFVFQNYWIQKDPFAKLLLLRDAPNLQTRTVNHAFPHKVWNFTNLVYFVPLSLLILSVYTMCGKYILYANTLQFKARHSKSLTYEAFMNIYFHSSLYVMSQVLSSRRSNSKRARFILLQNIIRTMLKNPYNFENLFIWSQLYVTDCMPEHRDATFLWGPPRHDTFSFL